MSGDKKCLNLNRYAVTRRQKLKDNNETDATARTESKNEVVKKLLGQPVAFNRPSPIWGVLVTLEINKTT